MRYNARMHRLAILWTLLLLVTLAAGCVGPGRFVVRVSQQQVQQRIAKRFPLERKHLVFLVRLEQPRVSFVAGGQISIRASAVALVAGVEAGRASAVIQGRVRYDAETHFFYLADPQVTGLEADHMPARYLRRARRAVNQFTKNALPQLPIYRLDGSKHRLGRALLKRAWVCGQELCLEMGL